MTGIGFDTCPECESPWKPREGGDKQCNRYNCPCNTGLSNSCPSEPEDEKCKCGYIEGRTYDHSDAMCNLCYGKVPYFPPKPEDEKREHDCEVEILRGSKELRKDERERVLDAVKEKIGKIEVSGGGSGRRIKIQMLALLDTMKE